MAERFAYQCDLHRNVTEYARKKTNDEDEGNSSSSPNPEGMCVRFEKINAHEGVCLVE